MTITDTRFGQIGLIGRPNVGKSTLMNRILGHKVSITSRKPQTTQNRIIGVKTIDQVQMAFIDTPGIQTNRAASAHRQFNRHASTVFDEVDVIVFLVDAQRWTTHDDWIVTQLKETQTPVILAINKADQIKNKEELLPFIEAAQARFPFLAMIPISAQHGHQVSRLESMLTEQLPLGSHRYDKDTLTNQTDRQMVAEIIREKLMRHLGQELPYIAQVDVEECTIKNDVRHVTASITVPKASQKMIVIGRGGERIKKINTEARLAMQTYFNTPVYFRSWVAVKAPGKTKRPSDLPADQETRDA